MEKTDEKGFSIYNYVKTNWKNILIVLLLVLLTVIIIWNRVSNARKQKQWEADISSLYEAATSFSQAKDMYFLELFTHSFSLAMISELSRGNIENVGTYATSILKKDVRLLEIVVADKSNNIIISTNKVHEGRNLNDYFPFNYLNLKGISIVSSENEDLIYCVSPLYILNQQNGVVVIKYKPEHFIWKGNATN